MDVHFAALNINYFTISLQRNLFHLLTLINKINLDSLSFTFLEIEHDYITAQNGM